MSDEPMTNEPMTDEPMTDEQGQVAGIEALPFGLLVLVVGALIVVNVWGVIDAKATVSAAAREVARAYVEASSASAAGAGSVSAGRSAVAAMGRDDRRLDVRVDTPAGFVRCGRVSATASYVVPAVRLPWIGSFGRGLRVTGRHTEAVDPLRSRVPGTASCVRAP